MATDAALSKPKTRESQIHGKQASDLILCYLVCATDAAGGFVGAILLTDHRARPEHFSYVKPLKPTKLQSILYGKTLEEHIKVDVIAQKLWQGLPKKPDVVFVEAPDQNLIASVRRIVQKPTAFIGKSLVAETSPSSLSTWRYDAGHHAEDQRSIGEIIVALEGTCDLLEPFARIRLALAEVLTDSRAARLSFVSC